MKKQLLLAALSASLIGFSSLSAEDKPESPRLSLVCSHGDEVEKASEDDQAQVTLSAQEEEEAAALKKAISCEKCEAIDGDETQKSLS